MTAAPASLPPVHGSILVVEDDPDIASLLSRFLQAQGHRVRVAADGAAMDAVLIRDRIDLVLLDVMLPGESGLSLCRRLHASGAVRVIMVTALSDTADRVAGLDVGADDYVAKPFDLDELAARIRAVLRRNKDAQPAAPGSATDAVLAFAGWSFFPQRRYLRSEDGLRVPLTGAEADLLLTFCQHPQEVLSREQLTVWTRGERVVAPERGIDLLVSRLRRKLAVQPGLPPVIQTVRSDGYMFCAPVSHASAALA